MQELEEKRIELTDAITDKEKAVRSLQEFETATIAERENASKLLNDRVAEACEEAARLLGCFPESDGTQVFPTSPSGPEPGGLFRCRLCPSWDGCADKDEYLAHIRSCVCRGP